MKVMPFLQAWDSVRWHEPTIEIHDVVSSAASPDVSGWDYLTPTKVAIRFEVDTEGFFAETELREIHGPDPLAGVDAVLQVDCIATANRLIARTPLGRGSSPQGATVSLVIPPGKVAKEIEIRAHVILTRGDELVRGLAAFRSGSRLHSAGQRWRIRLEGRGGSFPTEGFSFGEMGLPKGAAWFLNFSPQSFSESFVAQVRLFVNTDHPSSVALLEGEKLLQSVLFYDVLAELLQRSFAFAAEDISDEWEDDEGSLGSVLNALTGAFLGCDLMQARADYDRDPAKFKARLQAAARFLDPE